MKSVKKWRLKVVEQCIFCGIVKKEKPAYIIYEDEMVTAFLDINPIALGHTLVIPNKHFARLDAINDEKVMQGLMSALVKVSNMLVKAELCEDFTVLNDNGVNAQQDIMHIHFHIIPRHPNENIELKLPTNKEIATKEKILFAYNLIKNSV